MRTHVVINAVKCKDETVGSKDNIEDFLNKLLAALHTTALEGPSSVKRKGTHAGICSSVIGHEMHAVAHSLPEKKQMVVDIFSFDTMQVQDLQNTFLQHFGEDMGNVAIAEINDAMYSLVECEEVDCTRKATKDYNGRKVCADHFDAWRRHDHQLLGTDHGD